MGLKFRWALPPIEPVPAALGALNRGLKCGMGQAILKCVMDAAGANEARKWPGTGCAALYAVGQRNCGCAEQAWAGRSRLAEADLNGLPERPVRVAGSASHSSQGVVPLTRRAGHASFFVVPAEKPTRRIVP